MSGTRDYTLKRLEGVVLVGQLTIDSRCKKIYTSGEFIWAYQDESKGIFFLCIIDYWFVWFIDYWFVWLVRSPCFFFFASPILEIQDVKDLHTPYLK